MRFHKRNHPATASSPSASNSGANTRRRGLLLALGAGGAGAAALAARSLTGVTPQDGSGSAGDDSKGYQLTDHVKRYYGTTKI
jgi:hypothetical protein